MYSGPKDFDTCFRCFHASYMSVVRCCMHISKASIPIIYSVEIYENCHEPGFFVASARLIVPSHSLAIHIYHGMTARPIDFESVTTLRLQGLAVDVTCPRRFVLGTRVHTI